MKNQDSRSRNLRQNYGANLHRHFPFALTASVASVLTFTGLAEDRVGPEARPQERKEQAGHRMTRARADRLNGAIKSGDLVGMTVKNYRDETLGKIEDVAIDLESGRVVQLILSTGGFVGIGDRLTAVPPGALHHDATLGILQLDADKETVKNAPEVDLARWAECCETGRLSKVYRHYGEGAAYGFVHDSDPATKAHRDADGTWDGDRTTHDAQSMIPAGRLLQSRRVTQLAGFPVKNVQGEKLGKVENLLVDLGSGRVVAVVVSSGGFLGLGDELSAVPPTAMRFNAMRDELQLDTSKEALAAAPHFKANEWPDFAEPAYADRLYRSYRVRPYFTTNAVADADNTARNLRDRGGRTLTPLDQGSSAADVDITARIRRGILDGKDMSVNGKNVKVITNDGQVTLRGPVESANEKRIIGEIAIGIALAANVDNQLEVK